MRTSPMMLDVDTGIDDAAALAFAAGIRANLIGVSTVAGNVPIDLSTDNTLRVLSLIGKGDVPVFRGASRPLAATAGNAAHVHGGNGLGDVILPASMMNEAEMSGPEAIIEMANRFEGELTLVMLGPLTNLAMALSLRPGIVNQIARLVVMGGAYFTRGNITPHAEFNIYADPDAANQVLAVPWIDATVVGLDVTQQVAISHAQWQAIPEDATGAAGVIRAISAKTFMERARAGFVLHDPLAVAVALDPSLIDGQRYALTVSADAEMRGKTTAAAGGNVLVAREVHGQVFMKRLHGALGLPYVGDGRSDETQAGAKGLLPDVRSDG